MTKIVCPACKDLVEVTDRLVSPHGECQMSGMYYVPQKTGFRGGPELIGRHPVNVECHSCERTHRGEFQLWRQPNPTLN